MKSSKEETMMEPSDFARQIREGFTKGEKMGVPKAWKGIVLGHLIAETKSAFKINDLLQKIPV